MIVFISGPMDGYPGYNFEMFDRVAELFREQGHTVISPAELDREAGFNPSIDKKVTPEFLKAAILRDVKGILDSDTVALLPGWQGSEGVRGEIAVARWAKKPCFVAAIIFPEIAGAVEGAQTPDKGQ